MIAKLQDESSTGFSTIASADSMNLKSIGTNIGLILICVIVSFVSFWDLEFSFEKAFTVTWVSVLIYLVSTTVYNTKYQGGIYKGRQENEYKKAHESFCKLRNAIINTDLTDSLIGWCQDYVKKDMDQMRRSIISPYLPYEEYLLNYSKLSDKRVKELGFSKTITNAIIKANNIKPVSLTADMLLNLSFSKKLFGNRSALPRSGDEQMKMDFISNYASKFVITFLCGMIAIDVISDPSLETFLRWIVRMIPIVLTFLLGEFHGYRNATQVDSKRMNAQTLFLGRFFAENKERFDEEKKEAVAAYGAGERFCGEKCQFHRPANGDIPTPMQG